MVVVIQPQQQILELDPDWYAEAEANRQRANASDQALKVAVEALQNAIPVQKIKSGATTYSPDANGLVTLPSGVVLPATTTTERDAMASPTVGQAIFNTTNARPELYTPIGWRPFQIPAQIDVFTASGTWTKPLGARAVVVMAWGGGGSGAAQDTNNSTVYATGGGGGGYCQRTFLADLVGPTESVTVGTGGAQPAVARNGNNSQGNNGGASSFGQHLSAGLGRGGYAGSSSNQVGAGGTGDGFGTLNPSTGGSANPQNTSTSGSPLGAGSGGSAGPGVNVSNGGAGGGVGGAGQSASSQSNVSATASPGVSRTGLGRGGEGGGGALIYTTNVAITATATGGAGGIPGGGGGAGLCFNSQGSTTSGTAVAGAGARGEVIVITLF